MNFPKFLRVVVMATTRLVKLNSTSTILEKYFDKTDVEFTSILAQALKFSYKLVSPSDGEYGRKMPDGNWTGMVGMLLRNEADIIATTIAVTEQRNNILDFSFPFYITKITFITLKPEYSPEITAFLKPFSSVLWIFSIACLIILPAVFFVILQGRWSYQKIFFAIYASLLMKPFGLKPQNVKECFLIFCWMIGVIFLGYSYTCVLLSFITVPTLSTGVRTIPELAAAIANGKYYCVTYPGSYYGAAWATSKDPKSRIIGRNLLQNSGSNDIKGVLKNTKFSRNPAFVGAVEDFYSLKTKYFISNDEFLLDFSSIVMRKNFCCKEQFSRVVNHVLSSGIYEKLVNDAVFLLSLKTILHDDDADERVKQFSFKDIKGAFVVLSIGYTLSLTAFFGELIIHFFKKNLHHFERKYCTHRVFLVRFLIRFMRKILK